MDRPCRSLLIVCVVLLHISLCIYGQEEPIVHLKLGKVKGYVMKTRLGKDILAFRAIRYAKAPVGHRRFLPPEPVDPWHHVYDATKEGPACIQFSMRGNEDCLVLNVYTTRLPSYDSPAKLPVIVYIHAGGFRDGSGRYAGPQYLLDKGVLVVTINYRLGPLGFISTGDRHAPGNLGLKDQNLALRFVKDHIAAFGGNPNSITLAGMSAGSRSVYLHIFSPMSKGLFHRAIAMSGAAETLEPYPRDQKDLAIKLGKLLDCETESMDKMFKCLREKPAESFGRIQSHFWDWRGNPTLIWTPVIEPEIPRVKRFLTDQPNNLAKSGKFNQVPLITGVSRDEFGCENIRAVEEAKRGNNHLFNIFNKHWDEMAPITFMYERNTEKSKFISAKIKKFYFHNEPISLKNCKGRSKLFADAITIYPLQRTALLMAATSAQPIHFYLFEYEGPYSFYRWSDGQPYGASHQDEIFYIFHIPGFPMIKTTDKENEMVERLTTIWTHFAKTSKPIADNDPLFDFIDWKRFNPATIDYLKIGQTLEMTRNFFAYRMFFWKKLFPA